MELSLREQEDFRERLQEEMRRRGIEKQKDFAALLGISPTFLNQIFGRKRTGSRQLVNFAKRLKVPLGYLLGYETLPDYFPEYHSIPLVEGHIAANPAGRIPGDAVEALVWLHRSQLGGRHDLVAVRLGPGADSMQPALHPGDLIIIDRADHEITARGLYAVRLPDLESCAVKRVQLLPDQRHVLLLSDNPTYEPLPLQWHEHLIIGRVIWSWTNWVR
jgi:transcriptional regulator with XRE-family HTH domain